MDDVTSGTAAVAQQAGDALRSAREAQGLTLADIGERTRVPIRHLEAIEASDYSSLPSSTYAVGFARAYARAVDVDEVAVAHDVREEVRRSGPRQPEYTPYEIADQSRVPSRGIAIVALGLGLAVLILAGLWFGTDAFRPTDVPATAAQMAPTTPAIAPAFVTPRPAGGQVTLVANGEVWLRIYEAGGNVLRQGTLQPGERYDVPGDANGPMINVGRPDELTVMLNGSVIPPLGDGSRALKDVPVDAASIAARLSGEPAGTATPTLASTVASITTPVVPVTPTPTPTPTASPSLKVAPSPKPSTVASKKPLVRSKPRTAARPKRQLTETQRANLEAASKPPPPGPLR